MEIECRICRKSPRQIMRSVYVHIVICNMDEWGKLESL